MTPTNAPRTDKENPYTRKSSQLWNTLAAIKAGAIITFFIAIPGYTFVALAGVLMLCISLGSVAATGAAVMVIGNAILNAAHLPGYTSNAHAAAIGATGAWISILIFTVIPTCHQNPPSAGFDDFPPIQQPPTQSWFTMFVSLVCTIIHCTLTGVLGCAILRHNHVDLGGIDVAHSASAGALGGVLFSIGPVFFGPVITAVMLIILSPLFLAVKLGLSWVYIRSNSTWEQRGDWTRSSYSYCVCYGFSGEDEDIQTELAQIGHFGNV